MIHRLTLTPWTNPAGCAVCGCELGEKRREIDGLGFYYCSNCESRWVIYSGNKGNREVSLLATHVDAQHWPRAIRWLLGLEVE
jgi:hypothetical protein